MKNPVGRPKTTVAVNRAKLRALRIEKGLGQKDIAQVVGYCQPRISQIESGDSGVPLDALRKIADLLGCDYKELLEEE